MPLIDLALLSDAAFMRGLGAAFFFFVANLSFYLVMTLFMQTRPAASRRCSRPGLHSAGTGFRGRVAPQRRAGAASRHLVLIEGCVLQIAGLAALAGRRSHCRCAGAASLLALRA